MLDDRTLKDSEASWFFGALSNGIKVVHIPTSRDHRLFVSALFSVGARHERRAKAGISHFLEHMMFRGSQNYPTFLALADAFEWLGGHWNAETGQEHTEYTYSGIASTAGEVVKLFSEFLAYPRLLDIELEREVILREIEDELNEFGHSTDLDWHTASLIWPDSGLSNPIAGTLSTVRGISLADLEEHRRRNYTGDQLVLSMAGGPTTDALMEDLERYFGHYPLAAPAESPRAPAERLARFVGPKYRFVEHTDNQYHLQLRFVCDGEWSENGIAYELICRILADSFSSRLSLRLREELGLVYDISCDESLVSDAGTISIQAQVTPDKFCVVLKEICKILAEFRTNGPTDEELQKAKFRSQVRMSLATYEPEQLGFRLAWNYLHNRPSSLSGRIARIVGQDSDSIRRVADAVFQKSNSALVVMGPKDEALEQKAQDVMRKFL